MLCLPGFGTHANSQNLPHFRAFPASVQAHCPPKCLIFLRQNAKLPNRPGFTLLARYAAKLGIAEVRQCELSASASPKPHPSKPLPCKKVVLQKLHCNIRLFAVRTSFLPKAALQQAKKLHCSTEKLHLQISGGFLPLSCGFQAPTF